MPYSASDYELAKNTVNYLHSNWKQRTSLLDSDAMVSEFVALGQSAIDALAGYVNGERSNAHYKPVVLLLFAKFGEPGAQLAENLLKSPMRETQLNVLQALPEVGRPAIRIVTGMLDSEDSDMAGRAYRVFGQVGGSDAVPILLEHAKRKTLSLDRRESAIWALGNAGKSAIPALNEIYADDNVRLREVTAHVLTDNDIQDDDRAIQTLIALLEDNATTVKDIAITWLASSHLPVRTERVFEEIIDALIVRASRQKNDFFNAPIVSDSLQILSKRNPRLRGQILERLCDLAYQDDENIRWRSVAVARKFAPGDFSSLVKRKAQNNPKAASSILSLMGGNEAIAHFSEQQKLALDTYRAPLVQIEQDSTKRWDGVTNQVNLAFWVNIGLSIGVFIVGGVAVIWGLYLATSSRDLAQQIVGAGVAALSAAASTFSGRFWKDPVEHIQRFASQQARLQAAFIGYLNSVGQVRLIFEQRYATGQMNVEELERFQALLKHANEALDASSKPHQ